MTLKSEIVTSFWFIVCLGQVVTSSKLLIVETIIKTVESVPYPKNVYSIQFSKECATFINNLSKTMQTLLLFLEKCSRMRASSVALHIKERIAMEESEEILSPASQLVLLFYLNSQFTLDRNELDTQMRCILGCNETLILQLYEASWPSALISERCLLAIGRDIWRISKSSTMPRPIVVL